jgi:hypothetical protein
VNVNAPTEVTTHHVSVGDRSGLTFSPNQLNANIGDHIAFQFHAVNHTLTQSTLENPCASSGQMDSGFNQFNSIDRADLTLTITVNSLDPQWFFCRQDGPFSHCHAGMIFAINPGNMMNAFLSNAVKQLDLVTPVPSPVIATVTKTVTHSGLGTGLGIRSVGGTGTGKIQGASVVHPISTSEFSSGAKRLVSVPWIVRLVISFVLICLL